MQFQLYASVWQPGESVISVDEQRNCTVLWQTFYIHTYTQELSTSSKSADPSVPQIHWVLWISNDFQITFNDISRSTKKRKGEKKKALGSYSNMPNKRR